MRKDIFTAIGHVALFATGYILGKSTGATGGYIKGFEHGALIGNGSITINKKDTEEKKEDTESCQE